MLNALLVGSGVFWTATYIAIIWKSFQDKTYGMPLVALCANLSWEFIFSFLYPHRPLQRSINIIWLAFDSILLFQVLKYGPREFTDIPKWLFYAMFGLVLVTSFCTVLLVSYEFNDLQGVHAAFGQNMMMSALFITLFYQRKSLRGQSTWIALFKGVGTLLASLAFVYYGDAIEAVRGSTLIPFFCIATFVFDLIYWVIVASQQFLGWGVETGCQTASQKVT